MLHSHINISLSLKIHLKILKEESTEQNYFRIFSLKYPFVLLIIYGGEILFKMLNGLSAYQVASCFEGHLVAIWSSLSDLSLIQL